MPKTTKCETLSVIVVPEGGGEGRELVVPAYTRTPSDLKNVIEEFTQQYFLFSGLQNAQVSLGDLALFLLAAAAKEPRFIEGGGDAGLYGYRNFGPTS